MNAAFLRELERISGPGSVLTAPASLLVYSYDAALDKSLPGAVVLPRNAGEVAAIVKLAHDNRVPFVARGAGTNLCGGSIPAAEGLVIHLSRLNRILNIDPGRRRAVVEPGVINLHLQKAVSAHGLFYAPDPASQKACTLGGNVGTNAGGPHCLKHGVTTHHVQALEVVLPDGQIVRTDVGGPGFDVTGLFVGSEGTLGVVTRIEVDLLPVPEEIYTLLASFPSIDSAVQTVSDIISDGIIPTTLEIMDQVTVNAVEDFMSAGYPRDAGAVLLIEVDGKRSKVDTEEKQVEVLCRKNGSLQIRRAKDEKERQKLWEGRRGAYPSMARLAPNVLVEDGVVPRSLLPEAVRRIRAIADREKIRLGLIAHAGDGNLHPNMIFDERNAEEARKVKAAGYEMLQVCVDLGGSISGEHGIGTDKREAMKWLFTPSTLQLFHRIKNAFDPENLCNPDKLIPVGEAPAPLDLPAIDLPDAGEIVAKDVPHIQAVLKTASERRKPVFLKGQGTRGMQPPAGSLVLSVSSFNRIIEHDRSNFTLTVEAGITVREIQEFLSPYKQFAHISGGGTLGGMISSRSLLIPRLRDNLLGVRVVLADGQIVTFGGKVMKNVAGYDATKLFIGAWGTLGAIIEVSLRLFPFPAPQVQEAPPERSFEWAKDPLFRRIKTAFDPENLLNPSVFELMAAAR